jgi:type IV pilus assembly protein PilV
MLEVLITIVIVVFGLLGLAGLQARMQAAELESYQRTQALVLLQDMVDRITTNRKNAASYVTGSPPLGTGSTLDCSAPDPGAEKDLCDWNNALLGAAEIRDKDGANERKVGAVIGARGCISNPVTAAPQEFVVAIAWQGLTPTKEPGGSTCGQGEYGTDNELYRRVVVSRVIIACLKSDPVSGACAP